MDLDKSKGLTRHLKFKNILVVGLMVGVFSMTASAATPEPNPGDHTVNTEDSTATATKQLETSNIGPVPPKTEELESSQGYFYKYDRSFSPHIGFQSNFDSSSQAVIFGMGYMLPSLDPANHFEITVQLLTSGHGIVWAGYKHTYNPTRRSRPFILGRFGSRAYGDQLLATFVFYKNWLLSAGGGLEYVVTDPMSVRLEAGASSTLGMEYSYYITVGYSWGF